MTIVDEQHAIADEHFTGDDWTQFSKNEIRQPQGEAFAQCPRRTAADAEQGLDEPTISIIASAGSGLH
jgi:hypothetical protein